MRFICVLVHSLIQQIIIGRGPYTLACLGTVLVYAYFTDVIVKNDPCHSQNVPVQMINYMVTSVIKHLWPG